MEIPPITSLHETRSETTVRLFAERQDAPPMERQRIEDQLVRLNMKIAADAVRRFRGRGIPQEDLEQVAYLGLVKAVRGYDPDRGHHFLSFAIPTIRGEVRRYFRDLGWTVRPPRSIQETQSKVNAAEPELAQQLGRSPRPSELAAHLGIEVESVIEALGASGCFAPVSLDATVEADDEALSQRLGATEEGFDHAEARAVLAPLLSRLTPRERTIVEMRFVQGATQAEIGAAIGVTQMQVSRLLTKLMSRMREELTVPHAA